MGKYKFCNEGPERQKWVENISPLIQYFLKTYNEFHVSNRELKQHPIDISKLSLEDGKVTARHARSFFSPLDMKIVDSTLSNYKFEAEWPGRDQFFIHNCASASLLSSFIGSTLYESKLDGYRWLGRE